MLVTLAPPDLTEVPSSLAAPLLNNMCFNSKNQPWLQTSPLWHSRLPLPLRVQQPNASHIPRQPGYIVFHQQPIPELHFRTAQDISQPRSSWWQAEGWVRRPTRPGHYTAIIQENMTCFLPFICTSVCFIVIKRVYGGKQSCEAPAHIVRTQSVTSIMLHPHLSFESFPSCCGWSVSSSFSLILPLLRCVSYNSPSVRLPLAVKPQFFSLRCLRFVLYGMKSIITFCKTVRACTSRSSVHSPAWVWSKHINAHLNTTPSNKTDKKNNQ